MSREIRKVFCLPRIKRSIILLPFPSLPSSTPTNLMPSTGSQKADKEKERERDRYFSDDELTANPDTLDDSDEDDEKKANGSKGGDKSKKSQILSTDHSKVFYISFEKISTKSRRRSP
eukprot:TRINITY_DN811_c0_g2_i2.p2 TRINITY_DN811_c0_g2~~TRINITY_DN811_c0_g2_i2.p2  ORF type:complete len:118 (-),score=31.41 TRINITY_DN811_c0_g2_i2:213-566(-)